MHLNSYKLMEQFAKLHMLQTGPHHVLDVGSRDVNGTYRPLFAIPGWTYTGIDVVAGPNVDIVVDPYEWKLPRTYDTVVSGQCMEHVPDMIAWMCCVSDALMPGGIACIIVPCQQREHRYPLDCWRILPDGMRFLFEQAGLDPLEAYTSERDCVGIAMNPLEA